MLELGEITADDAFAEEGAISDTEIPEGRADGGVVSFVDGACVNVVGAPVEGLVIECFV